MSAVEEIVRDGSVSVHAVVDRASADEVERVMDAGADRIVVHAHSITDPQWLEGVAHDYPGAAILATGCRDGRASSRRTVHCLPDDVFDLIRELDGIPLGGLLVTVAGGNTSAGPADLALLDELAETADVPLFAVGGVSTMDDLRALEHRGVSAVVLGDVLYSGALDVMAVAREFGG